MGQGTRKMVQARREVRIIPKRDGEAGGVCCHQGGTWVDEFMLLGGENSFPKNSSGRKDCGQ